jgi:hypothetical protein
MMIKTKLVALVSAGAVALGIGALGVGSAAASSGHQAKVKMPASATRKVVSPKPVAKSSVKPIATSRTKSATTTRVDRDARGRVDRDNDRHLRDAMTKATASSKAMRHVARTRGNR